VFESTRTTKEIKDTLRVGGKQECNHSITIAKPVNIKKTDQILNPWFLGYWIGNGNKSTSVISFNLDDHADMARILKEQGISHSDVKMKAGTEKGAHFYIYGITALLRELGVIGNKKIPNHYLNGSRQQRLELLQGLLDSDGWISTPDKNGKKSSRVSFDTVKKDLAMDVLYLVNSLGFKGTLLKKKIPENNNYKTKNKFSYSVNFTPVDDVPVFKLTRKRLRQRYENTASAFTYVKDHYIKDISLPRKKVPMKCIQVDSPDGSFLCTEYFIPTHNSSVLSVTGLIYLSLYKVVVGNKVYAASTKKDQSRIILDAARIMAKKNTSYLRHTGTKVYAHHIAHEASGSEFRALSSDSNGLDGLLPLISIVDELHAHKTREIYDVMASAMSKRADSILVCITTAGFSLEGIGYSQSQYAKKVALGDIGDEAFFSLVYTLDEDDDWTDSKNWIKSNPNLGVSVDVEGLSSKAFKAINNPQDEVNFKVKHLNLWQNAAHQFFNVKKWNELANPNLKIEDFKNDPCYIGIDLASKIDLTSFAYVFKNKETEKYTVFVDNFIPKATLEESRNVFYKTWADKGHLIATEGNAVNLPKLQTDFVEKAKKYSVQAAHFDPWNATEFAQRMSMEHIEMLEFKMSTSNMSEPMKKLDALIREGRVEHNGNPLVAWCLGNVVAKVDANDNVFPRKEHESMKIDPIVAILMALAGWVKLENERSVYEERGLIIF
jgi:phage terminase large subunit-like protein